MAVHSDRENAPDLGVETYVTKIDTKTTKGGQPYLMVHFGDGRKVHHFNAGKIRVTVGDYGIPTLTAKTIGDRTYYDLADWRVTKPASPGVVTASGERIAVGHDQAIWDAKDRGIDMESAHKSAARLTSALIAQGVYDKEKDPAAAALAFQLQAATAMYEQMLMARANRIATKVNPFADE